MYDQWSLLKYLDQITAFWTCGFYQNHSKKSFKTRPNIPYGEETSRYSLLQGGVSHSWIVHDLALRLWGQGRSQPFFYHPILVAHIENAFKKKLYMSFFFRESLQSCFHYLFVFFVPFTRLMVWVSQHSSNRYAWECH